MLTFRKAATVLAVSSAAALAVPMTAGAQTTAHSTARAAAHPMAAHTTASSLNNIPMTGRARNGKAFTGKMTVSQFVTRGGATYAVGVLSGRLGHRSIKPQAVEVPASVMQNPAGTATTAAVAPVCQVLNLVLGPLHLNLLGLHVDLNQVLLNITAQSGAGQLLGNLLCGVSNLLNTQSVAGGQLTGLLNIVQQLLGNAGLLNL